MPKQISIIGGGWYGCHLGLSLLRRGFNVRIYEKNNCIFNEASTNNQNRLHLGFHYPRSHKTRIQSKRGYRLFRLKYPDLISNIDLSLYAISSTDSLMDFETYKLIMSSSGLIYEDVSNCVPIVINNIQGVIDCDEGLINSKEARSYFENELADIIKLNYSMTKEDCKKLARDGIVIDCTWNKIFNNLDIFYEPTIMFKYKNSQTMEFGLTIMDGQLCSIFPYDNDYSTLSDVQFTPIGYCSTAEEAYKVINSFSTIKISEIKSKMEQKMSIYFPALRDYFSDGEPFFSIKTKAMVNKSDNRYSYLTQIDSNTFSVFAGKIDTIFDIEFSILSLLQNKFHVD